MAFATDSDLLNYIPTIFDHGPNTYIEALEEAHKDVVRIIQTHWFNKIERFEDFDEKWLDGEQWTRAVVYRALGYYILPRLSSWRSESDSFRNQIEFYQARFDDEMDAVFAIGVRYDFDEDSTIDETTETEHYYQNRLWR
jgi:hypothetical protein